MSKDPAFLFYPGDWLGGTLLMTRHHKGAYMDLLMAQYNNGHLTPSEIDTVLGEKDQPLWDLILKYKFKKDSEGRFYNEKLEGEMIKRKSYTDSRKKNLNKEESHKAPHMEPHMENENENDNEVKDKEKREESEKGKGKTKIWSDTVLTTYSKILPLFDPEYHPSTTSTQDRWLDTIDKLIRIDKRTPDQIYQLIKKVRADRFWNQNFRSVCKLRDKDKDDIQYLIVFEKRFNGTARGEIPNKNLHDFMDKKAQEILDKYGPDKPINTKQNGR